MFIKFALFKKVREILERMLKEGEVDLDKLEEELKGFTFSLPETFDGDELVSFFANLLNLKPGDSGALRECLNSLGSLLDEMDETKQEAEDKELSDMVLRARIEAVDTLLRELKVEGLCSVGSFDDIPVYIRLGLVKELQID